MGKATSHTSLFGPDGRRGSHTASVTVTPLMQKRDGSLTIGTLAQIDRVAGVYRLLSFEGHLCGAEDLPLREDVRQVCRRVARRGEEKPGVPRRRLRGHDLVDARRVDQRAGAG